MLVFQNVVRARSHFIGCFVIFHKTTIYLSHSLAVAVMKVNILGILLSLSSACANQPWEKHCAEVSQEYDALFGETGAEVEDILSYGKGTYNLKKLEEALKDAQEKLEPKPNFIEACTMITISPAADDLAEFPKFQTFIDKTPKVMNCLLAPNVSVLKTPSQIYMALAAFYKKPGVDMVIWNKTMLDADFTDCENFGWVLAANNVHFLNDLYSGVIKVNPKRPLPKINLAIVESVIHQLCDNDADESLKWLVDKGFDPKLILWKYSEISESPKIHKLLKECEVEIAFTEHDIRDIISTGNDSFYYLVAKYAAAGGNITILARTILKHVSWFTTFSENDAILYEILISSGIKMDIHSDLRHKALVRNIKPVDNAITADEFASRAYLYCDLMDLNDILQQYPDAIVKNPSHNIHPPPQNKCRDASTEDLWKITNWAKVNGIAPHKFLFVEAARRGDGELWNTLGEAPEAINDKLYIEASQTSEVEMMKNLVEFKVPISKEGCWGAMSYAIPEIQDALESSCKAVSFDPNQGYSLEDNTRGLFEWTRLDWAKKVWPAAVTKECLNRLIEREIWVLALVVHRALREKLPDDPDVRGDSTILWAALNDDLKDDLLVQAPLRLILDMLEDGSIEKLKKYELTRISCGIAESDRQPQYWKLLLRMNEARGGAGIEKVSPELFDDSIVKADLLQVLHRDVNFLPSQDLVEATFQEEKSFDLFYFWVVKAGKTLNNGKDLIKEISSVPMDQFNMLVWLGAAEKGVDPKIENDEKIATSVFNDFEDPKSLVSVCFLEYLAKHNFFELFKQAFVSPDRLALPSQVALYYICGHGNLEWIKMIYDQFRVLPDERAKAHAAANGHYHVIDYLLCKENDPTAEDSGNRYENFDVVEYVYQMSWRLPDEELLTGKVLEFVKSIKNSSTEDKQRDLDDDSKTIKSTNETIQQQV